MQMSSNVLCELELSFTCMTLGFNAVKEFGTKQLFFHCLVVGLLGSKKWSLNCWF